MATGALGQYFWATVGDRLGLCLREEFFASAMRQEVGFFDDSTSGKLASMLSSDIEQVRNATSDKVATFLSFIGQALSGIVIGN